jgi:hypothetical protein
MQKLAADMHVDKLALFQRWWDTANKWPGKIQTPGGAANVFCSSEEEPSGGLSTKNNFPFRCPRDEGEQAARDPFAGDPFADEASEAGYNAGYTAIAFSNRFDLADQDRGRHCGEFRIVFAKNSGFKNATDRNLIIFEALVPNPQPPVVPSSDHWKNLEGCRPIVEFWLSLSNPKMSTAQRGTSLHDFFLYGLPKDKIGPVVDASHYAGGPASGQIRTNQLMKGVDWTLREFKTDCTSIVPATDKNNPGSSLFALDPRNVELAAYLVSKDTLDNLRGIGGGIRGPGDERSVDTFALGLATPALDHLNSFESEEIESFGDVVAAFNGCIANETHANDKTLNRCEVGKAMDRALAEANPKSTLKTNNIIRRIRVQTCAGCHHYSNGETADALGVTDLPNGWPKTLGGSPDVGGGFTHVTESEPGECNENDKLADLPPVLSMDTLKASRPERISHLSYKGPDGTDSRYKISDTLKLILMPPRFETMVMYLNQFDPPN